MNKQEIIEKTKAFVKEELSGENTGHDWWHVYRVWKTAVYIGNEEKADMFIVELAALLHDISDWKLNKADVSVGPDRIRQWLEKLKVENNIIETITAIIRDMSFIGADAKKVKLTKEGMVVQDSDRLDALGAIGIARAFASGQKFNQEIYNPEIKPNLTSEEYKKNYTGERKSTTINHFYEKLLLLKDRMNTKTGKKIAEKRHKIMENYLEEFYREWVSEDLI